MAALLIVLLLGWISFSCWYTLTTDKKRIDKINAELGAIRGRDARYRREVEIQEEQRQYFLNERLSAKLWRYFAVMPFGLCVLAVVYLCILLYRTGKYIYFCYDWLAWRAIYSWRDRPPFDRS